MVVLPECRAVWGGKKRCVGIQVETTILKTEGAVKSCKYMCENFHPMDVS